MLAMSGIRICETCPQARQVSSSTTVESVCPHCGHVYCVVMADPRPRRLEPIKRISHIMTRFLRIMQVNADIEPRNAWSDTRTTAGQNPHSRRAAPSCARHETTTPRLCSVLGLRWRTKAKTGRGGDRVGTVEHQVKSAACSPPDREDTLQPDCGGYVRIGCLCALGVSR
jgi:hypothetical protein